MSTRCLIILFSIIRHLELVGVSAVSSVHLGDLRDTFLTFTFCFCNFILCIFMRKCPREDTASSVWKQTLLYSGCKVHTVLRRNLNSLLFMVTIDCGGWCLNVNHPTKKQLLSLLIWSCNNYLQRARLTPPNLLNLIQPLNSVPSGM